MNIEMTQEDYNAFMLYKAMKDFNCDPTINLGKERKRRLKGTGTVYRLTGRRTRPWVARVFLGNGDDGRRVYENIGFFKTELEAKNALDNYALYGRPRETRITFAEIWNKVEKETVSKKSKSTQSNYVIAFNQFESIEYKPINLINLYDLQPIFDREMAAGSGTSKLSNMKTVCKMIYEYAIKYDYTEKDYSHYIKYESTSTKTIKHYPFTKDEIKKLFEMDTKESKIILIYIYTGLRPQELLRIEKNNVHLDDGYMIGGIKTLSGINRVIPIHDCIKPFVKELLDDCKKYLVYNSVNDKIADQYRNQIFTPTMSSLGIDHKPYDTRHTFATLCNEYNLNEYLIKKMMGHKCKDITKDVYTHATIDRLIGEVNLLPNFSRKDGN